MKRTALLVVVACLSVHAQEPEPNPAPPQEPPIQGPTFRTGVELVTVDVGVSDDRGRPVTDLLPPDFVVKIDGEVRKVVSAEHVRIDVEAARAQAKVEAESETFFTSNLTPPNGRMIVIAVDQSNIRPGAARPLLASAANFLKLLSPADRVAFISYPAPGVAVDFTTDHAKIRGAMTRVTGAQSRHRGRFNIGMYEAKAIIDNRDEITLRNVVMRECAGMSGFELERCERDIEMEAGDIVTSQRLDTAMALRGLQDLLRDLSFIEGQKNLILLSEGLVLESGGAGELEEIARLAAVGRVTINVLLMDVPRFEVTQAQLPPSAGEDRDLQVQGLENLAGMSRGALFRVIGSGDAIFERLASEMSAYYLLGVEQLPGDRDGKRHRIDVEVRRRNVNVRSRRAFVVSTAAGPGNTPQERLLNALKTPFAVAEVPLRVTSYAYQDANVEKVRILVTAEVGQSGAPAGDYNVGYLLIDDQGTLASSGQDKRRLEPIEGRANLPLGFIASMVVDPGIYTLRLGVVDPEGRRGSVLRDVRAWQTAGEEFTVGDLIVGGVPSADRPMLPQVEPRVRDGRLAAYVELYAATPAAFDGAEVSLEIADEEHGAALTTVPARIVEGGQPGQRIAQALVPARMLPPGRYVARAQVSRGGRPAGVLARPFVLEPPASAEEGGAVAVPVSMLASIPRFEREAVLTPEVLSSMLDIAQQRSPGLADAMAAARAGRYGPAALAALAANDQPAAMFLRGLDLLAKGEIDQAATQFHNAAGPRREYFPAAFYLGALMAAGGRDRDAAGIWQLALGQETRPALAYTLFADARLRDGQPGSVIDVLKPALERLPGDDQIAKRLALAYVMTGRYAEALPVLDTYLAKHPSDPDALFSIIMAQYEVTSRARVPLSDVERAKLTKYARAYKGPQQALVSKYLEALDGR